jgi:gliding-associated putative ABC transporter substrate-binding component GldG
MKDFLTKFKKQYNLGTQVAIVVGIIAVLNFLSYQIFTRFDLTQGKIYSLSAVSKQAAKDLKDAVNIKAYFSESLPTQYLNVKQEVEDILAEYQSYAGNKLRVEFIDPKADEELQRRLQMLGVPQLQFNVLENDKYQVINGYLALVVSYGDKQQAIPVVSDTKNLEYQLTGAIKKVTVEKFPIIGFASGNGELGNESEMSFAGKKLNELYATQTVDLSKGEEISKDIDTLIIAGPKTAFSERTQYVIDQFIMSGKSVIFLINGANVDDSLQAVRNEGILEKLLSGYGIKIEPALTLDTSSDMASFNQGYMTFTTQYPFFVKVGESGLDQNNAAVAKLQSLIFPWGSPITVSGGRSEAKVDTLAKTTEQAWLMKDNFNLSPQGDFGATGASKGIYNLAISINGKLNSAFTKYVPKDKETGQYLNSTENARLIVVGDANFIKDNFVRRYPDNLTFFQNIVDAVSLDSDLISIRSKAVSERPLKQISDSRKRTIKYGNIFGITVVVLAFGLLRYFNRKKSRFADEL